MRSVRSVGRRLRRQRGTMRACEMGCAWGRALWVWCGAGRCACVVLWCVAAWGFGLPVALGWSKEGHRIVGEIASGDLTPAARKAIADLLDGKSLADVANWADEIRSDPKYRWAARLHYANVPPGEKGFDLKRDCPDKRCVVGAILKYTAILRDADADRAAKVEALKFLVHFVGDIHQPLHLGYSRDRGGNDIRVEFFHNTMNLHQVWDYGLIRRVGKPWTEYAGGLTKRIGAKQREGWHSLDPAVWATESYQLAVRYAYVIPKDGRLGQAYMDRCIPVVDVRLSAAGVRLGALLNEVFSAKTPGKNPVKAPSHRRLRPMPAPL